MDPPNELTDEEFVPFLHGLAVETYKKSFEWMLSDPDYSGILRWLYNNLDKNNALNAREDYRFTELEANGALLSDADLKTSISSIHSLYPGLLLPGDDEALEDMKAEVKVEMERLKMLKKQEELLNELLGKNEHLKEDLNCHITQIQGSTNQAKAEEKAASEECTSLALEVDRVTEDVVDIITRTLTLYADTASNKEVSRNFYTFGPFEVYRQSQAMFRSHFDLYCTKKFTKRQSDNVISENELRCALIEARNMEERLLNAILAYKDAKTDLEGERAKLALACNYDNRVYPSQISLACMEARSAIEMLEQEEGILEEQIVNAAKSLVAKRTSLHTDTAVKAAYDFRQMIYSDLCHVHTLCQSALALDTLVYYALRHEHRSLHDATQFAQQLARYLCEENTARKQAIETMMSITTEQELAFDQLQSDDLLFNALRTLLALPPKADVKELVRSAINLIKEIKELKEKIQMGFKKKEDGLSLIKDSYDPIVKYVYSGCTKQANCWDQSVAALAHALSQQLATIDKRTTDAAPKLTQIKNGDKNYLRKLWQWFLTDAAKFVSFINETQGKSYS